MGADMDKEKISVFDKLESFYLSAMRKALLVFSTILFVYAVGAGLYSLYKVTRSADDVVEAKPNVNAADIIPSQSSPSSGTQGVAESATEQSSTSEKDPFDAHASRMFSIWQGKFEVHKRKNDPKLSESEFTSWYQGAWYNFNTPQWCAEDVCTDAEFEAYESDLALAETAITAAADDQTLKSRMAAASSGQSDGYDNVFVDLNRNFWEKMTVQRQVNKEAAEAERVEIAAGNVAGGLGLVTAGWAFAAFISLMFAFLIVAIERHQRKMARDIERIKANLKDE
jgi:hypothetical protein